MKKFIVLGSGTSGLIAATMIKRRWKDKVHVSLYYDGKKKNIGVGESTTPTIHYFLKEYLKVDLHEFLRDTGSTVKLGISFREWIKGTDYFHGFPETNDVSDDHYPESLYSILTDQYDGGSNTNIAANTVPNHTLEFLHALHIDTQVFSDYVRKEMEEEIDFIDDVATEIKSDGKNINSIVFEKSGEVTADFYVDCSGFKSLLLKELSPEWVDITDKLPVDRAIAQQVPHDFEEFPTYTIAEATDNGWTWQIPIQGRYGTGYVYSSKFLSDEDAKEKYGAWLKEKHGVELDNYNFIKYKPGFYKKNWIGNCLAIGLSSGFIEPLESTGIHIIVQQMLDFIRYNTTLKNLEYNKTECNRRNNLLYDEITEFICLHYNTNRTDSPFWRYMTENKSDWVKMFDEKCRQEFLDHESIEQNKEFWHIDSYIQVAQGLKLFNPKSIQEWLDSLSKSEEVYEECRQRWEELNRAKVQIGKVPHRCVLNGSVVINR